MTTYSGSRKMTPSIETKVKAATGGAVLGEVVAQFALWLIDTTMHTPAIEGDVPGPVTLLVATALPAAFAYGLGWLAKHTARPDLPEHKR